MNKYQELLPKLKELYYQLESSEFLMNKKRRKIHKLKMEIIDIEWEISNERNELWNIIREMIKDE